MNHSILFKYNERLKVKKGQAYPRYTHVIFMCLIFIISFRVIFLKAARLSGVIVIYVRSYASIASSKACGCAWSARTRAGRDLP